MCRENIARRPGMPLAFIHLAYLERARGNLPGAVAAVHKAFELRPLDGEAANLYAVYLTEAGRPREALEFLNPLLEAITPDIDLLTAQGMALAALGRRDEALAAFAKARTLDPSNPMVLVNAGTVYLQSGDRVRARQAFEAALDIDPSVSRAENSLGVIAAMEGRHEEAIVRWKRAVELNPGDYQTLFNLGFTLKKQGRDEEARPYFEAYLRVAPLALEARDIARVRGWLGSTDES
jgi:Flp pilus assembly protein TadD